MELAIRIVGNAAGLWLASRLLPASVSLPANATTLLAIVNLLIIGAVLAAVNSVVKPVAKVLTFPLYLLTFGLFALVVNGAMLRLTGWITEELLSGAAGDRLAVGLMVNGWSGAIPAALITSVVSAVVVAALHRKRD
ncbi:MULTISPECIES: phage holin family protein [Actinomyces]|uniref:Phage holin family protein n=1 Tax=Actinomyces marmotae TaxID=2737173 RepID=A0A6M8B296_9ACTO|nr:MULTISPECIES: phage holin family protein [Actinomyces]QKD78887.1 phage holin family protein [Actinomyces marmotae]